MRSVHPYSTSGLDVLTSFQANSGIGFALATLLVEDSSKHVIISSRSTEKGEAALKELKGLELPGSVELLQLDVTSASSIEAAAKSVENYHGRYVVLDVALPIS